MKLQPYASLEDVIDALESADVEVTDSILLRCESGFIGEVINRRYLKTPCRGRHCRTPGKHTDHVTDIWTGVTKTLDGERRNMGTHGAER